MHHTHLHFSREVPGRKNELAPLTASRGASITDGAHVGLTGDSPAGALSPAPVSPPDLPPHLGPAGPCHLYLSRVSLWHHVTPWLLPSPGKDRGCVICICPISSCDFLSHLGQKEAVTCTCPVFPCDSLIWDRQGPESALHSEPHMQVSGLLGARRPPCECSSGRMRRATH